MSGLAEGIPKLTDEEKHSAEEPFSPECELVGIGPEDLWTESELS